MLKTRTWSVLPLEASAVENILRLRTAIQPDIGYWSESLESQEHLTEILAAESQLDYRLSRVLLVDNKLAGFLIAWLDNTQRPGILEEVVLVEDIGLVPGTSHGLYFLFRSLIETITISGLSGTPIEIRSIAEGSDFLQRHKSILNRLGYDLVEVYPAESLQRPWTLRLELREEP